MKNIALIIAGGVGARMGQDIPKQFINVNDKPVIVYTLEAFQRHPMVDGIEVVCLDEWQGAVNARKGGYATKQQEEWLDYGHWKA